MDALESVSALSLREKEALAEVFTKYSIEFITEWDGILPTDILAKQLIKEDSYADFLAEMYGTLDPTLLDSKGVSIHMGDLVATSEGVGMVVGIDEEANTIDVDINEEDKEVTLKSSLVTLT